jgi:hypothetical protein
LRPGRGQHRSRGISWTHSHWGEIASGLITADMSGEHIGWLRIVIGSLDQRITLFPRPRHFGDRQWYFVCPVTNELASDPLRIVISRF